MEKITIKEILEFKNKGSEKSKRNFANKLKTRKPELNTENKENQGGGNYWVISNSVIYNIFKNGKDEYSDNKIDEVLNKIKNSEDESNNLMYNRNIEIINNFKEFNILSIRPTHIETFESVPKSHKIIEIESLPIYLNPQLIFKFEENESLKIGALLIASKIGGYAKSDIRIIVEALYHFLLRNFGEKIDISKEYCIVIDSYNASKLSYAEIDQTKINSLLINTLKEIKKL